MYDINITRWRCILPFIIFMLLVLSRVGEAVESEVGTPSVGKADGVAIWVHPEDRSKSVVIGADPSKGLATFGLKGEFIEAIDFGNTAGGADVDVRYDFPLGGEKISLVVSANKRKQTLRIYKMDPATRLLEEITGTPVELGVKAYGSCLYHSEKAGKYYAFVTSREGGIEQWELYDNGKGKVDAKLVRGIDIMNGAPREDMSPRTEACVADDANGWIYISQESECLIWRYGAEPDAGEKRILIADTRVGGHDSLEGLAIVPTGAGKSYLLVSIETSYKFKIYDRDNDYAYLGMFEVQRPGGSEPVENNDGIEVVNLDFGSSFPDGLFVMQSLGDNGDHYELASWGSVANRFKLDSGAE